LGEGRKAPMWKMSEYWCQKQSKGRGYWVSNPGEQKKRGSRTFLQKRIIKLKKRY